MLVAGWKHASCLCYAMGARWFLRFLGPKLELPRSRAYSPYLRCLCFELTPAGLRGVRVIEWCSYLVVDTKFTQTNLHQASCYAFVSWPSSWTYCFIACFPRRCSCLSCHHSVPARLGKGQGAKEIGHNLARERPKFGHNLVRERHIIFYA